MLLPCSTWLAALDRRHGGRAHADLTAGGPAQAAHALVLVCQLISLISRSFRSVLCVCVFVCDCVSLSAGRPSQSQE